MPRTQKKSISAEIRIKEAAHKVFLAKGFSATTVRDVAKDANTNVASVSYYFGSKKELFNVVMLEKLGLLIGALAPIVNNESTTLEEKIDGIVNSYIEFLKKNPDLITFTMNEIRKENFEFIPRIGVSKLAYQSPFMRQLKAEYGTINSIHFQVTLISMIVFPFVAKPMMVQSGLTNEKMFHKMMEERKLLIPFWFKAMLKNK